MAAVFVACGGKAKEPRLPEGTIAYLSDGAGGHIDVMLVETDGSGGRNLMNTPLVHENGPLWSPDGWELTFVRARGITADLYVLTINGGAGERRLTRPSPGRRSLWLWAWLPSGGIVFDSQYGWESDPGFHSRTDTIDATGSRVATPRFKRFWPYLDRFSLSPDGRHVVVAQDPGLAVMDYEGGNRRVLSQRHGDKNPTWSPQGDLIAFQRREQGHWFIYVVEPDGGSPRRISSRPGFVAPSWSPDGEFLAVGKFNGGGGQRGIYVLSLDSGKATFVAPSRIPMPAWRPNHP